MPYALGTFPSRLLAAATRGALPLTRGHFTPLEVAMRLVVFPPLCVAARRRRRGHRPRAERHQDTW